MTDPTKSKLAQALRLIADVIEADEPQAAPAAPKLIHVTTEALAPYGLGPAVVRAAIEAGELPATVGSRRRLLVEESALIAWRDSRPIPIRTPKKREIPAENEDVLSAMVRRGELRKVGTR